MFLVISNYFYEIMYGNDISSRICYIVDDVIKSKRCMKMVAKIAMIYSNANYSLS